MVVSTFLVTWLGSFHKIHLDSVAFLTTFVCNFAMETVGYPKSPSCSILSRDKI